MSGVDIAGLVSEWRKAMEGATPGEWQFAEGLPRCVYAIEGDSPRTIVRTDVVGSPIAEANANAAWVARCSPSGISALLDALLAQAADLAEARERETALEKWRDYYRELLKATEQVLGESRAEIGELKDRLKNSYFESYARELCYRLAAENEAKRATRQRDEALAALKASEERGKRLFQELASARCPQELVEAREEIERREDERKKQLAINMENIDKAVAAERERDEAEAVLHGLFRAPVHLDGCLHKDNARLPCQCGSHDRYRALEARVHKLLRARDDRPALENSPAGLADATNNPPSDPGTEQREAGV